MKFRMILIVLLLAGVMTSIQSGCCGMRRLSGAEFMKKAEVITQINSAIGCQYVGISGRRAYLEWWDVFGIGYDRTIVYWTPLAELPTNVVARLKAGDPPWTPPVMQTNKINPAHNHISDGIRQPADGVPEPSR